MAAIWRLSKRRRLTRLAKRRMGRRTLSRLAAILQQRVGDHGGEDLQADGVLAEAQGSSDFEALLDPSEQQFGLPAAFAEGGDVDGGTLEIVGDEGDGRSVFALDAEAAPVGVGQGRARQRSAPRWRRRRLSAFQPASSARELSSPLSWA